AQAASDFVPLQLPAAMFTGPGLLALADLLPVMTAYIDRDRRYRFINKPLAEWLEQPRKSLIGRTMREVIGAKAYDERKPMLDAALKGERVFFASTFDHPTRGLVAAQSDYVPWLDPATGKVDGVVIVVTDISEQRATEQALRESEARFRRIADSAPAMMWVTRLDRKRDFVNDAYAEFVGLPREDARIYDWRSAIHPDDAERVVAESVAGEATLKPFTLEARYRRHDGEYRWLRSVSQPRFGVEEEKLKGYADNALAAAERGARLTGQLLAFSRVQRLEVRPTHVAPLIQNMRPLLRNVLGPGIEKRFDLDEEMVPVMADPTQLEVAVLNLAINARDAMPDGGVLSFATQIVRVTDDAELEDGKYVALTISDPGSGMTEEIASRAFEPFFTTKEVGKGTGLGLSMVYGMARQSGGTARIESTP